MIDPNKRFRKRLRTAFVAVLCCGAGMDVFLAFSADWHIPLVSIYCFFLGCVFLSLGDTSGARYMEFHPEGVMQKYLFWRKLTPWSDFRQIGVREYSGRMGKEYRHSLVLLQGKAESVDVSVLFSLSRAFSSMLICPDTPEARETINRFYGPLDFDIPQEQPQSHIPNS